MSSPTCCPSPAALQLPLFASPAPPPQPQNTSPTRELSPLAMPPALLLGTPTVGTISSSAGDLVLGGTMPTAEQTETPG